MKNRMNVAPKNLLLALVALLLLLLLLLSIFRGQPAENVVDSPSDNGIPHEEPTGSSAATTEPRPTTDQELLGTPPEPFQTRIGHLSSSTDVIRTDDTITVTWTSFQDEGWICGGEHQVPGGLRGVSIVVETVTGPPPGLEVVDYSPSEPHREGATISVDGLKVVWNPGQPTPRPSNCTSVDRGGQGEPTGLYGVVDFSVTYNVVNAYPMWLRILALMTNHAGNAYARLPLLMIPTDVNVAPRAEFTWRQIDGHLTMAFDATGSYDTDGDIVDYQWDFGDGQNGSGLTATHSYEESGSYVVSLTVTDNEGAQNTKRQSITMNLVVVNSTADHPHADPGNGNGSCDTGEVILRNGVEEPECTLRAAVQEANYHHDGMTIAFDIPGTGIPVINIEGEPLEAWRPVFIDGTTQPGTGRVEIDGGYATQRSFDDRPPAHHGLIFQSSGSHVRGLAIYGFSGWALILRGQGHHTLVNNYIGTDASGLVAMGNGRITDVASVGGFITSGGGLLIESVNNVIGGIGDACTEPCNVISGNGPAGAFVPFDDIDVVSGVAIFLAHQATGNVIKGNFIGPAVDGAAPPADGPGNIRQAIGIMIEGGHSNVIGGSTPGDGNLLAFQSAGLQLNGQANDNVVQGNRFESNTISLIVDGQRNLVEGNTVSAMLAGVSISGGHRNVIRENTFGGSDAGVHIAGGGDGNLIEGNRIEDSTNAIRLIGAVNSQIVENVITRNHNGIVIWMADDYGNLISRNSISENTGLGIDLGGDGVTANDESDRDQGPNNLQNFPVIGRALFSNGRIAGEGSLEAAPGGGADFTIELFGNITCNPSGYGEGETFLNALEVVSDFSGRIGFEFDLAVSGSRPVYITATATDGAGNTSEFSACRLVE